MTATPPCIFSNSSLPFVLRKNYSEPRRIKMIYGFFMVCQRAIGANSFDILWRVCRDRRPRLSLSKNERQNLSFLITKLSPLRGHPRAKRRISRRYMCGFFGRSKPLPYRLPIKFPFSPLQFRSFYHIINLNFN